MGFSRFRVEVTSGSCHQTAIKRHEARQAIESSAKAPLGHAHQIGGDAGVGMEKTERVPLARRAPSFI